MVYSGQSSLLSIHFGGVMTTFVKTIAAILLTLVAVGIIDFNMRAEEESTCSFSSAEWCGMMYQDRLADAHQELASCQMQHPQGPHANHDEGCIHSLCDESTEAFTQWVFPANSYLLRRVELSDKDYELQVLLAEHIGGTPEQWPMPVKTVAEMGY